MKLRNSLHLPVLCELREQHLKLRMLKENIFYNLKFLPTPTRTLYPLFQKIKLLLPKNVSLLV